MQRSLRAMIRHFCLPAWVSRRVLDDAAMERIAEAIRLSEQAHDGEIRFVIETALPTARLIEHQSARDRALDLFALLRVWDTEANTGVLIYVLLADHDVEIIADRGINRRVGPEKWEQLCQEMEGCFREGRFEEGVLRGIDRIHRQLVVHFPKTVGNPNELPDLALRL